MFMIAREKKKNPYLTPFGKFWIIVIALGLCAICVLACVYSFMFIAGMI